MKVFLIDWLFVVAVAVDCGDEQKSHSMSQKMLHSPINDSSTNEMMRRNWSDLQGEAQMSSWGLVDQQQGYDVGDAVDNVGQMPSMMQLVWNKTANSIDYCPHGDAGDYQHKMDSNLTMECLELEGIPQLRKLYSKYEEHVMMMMT